MACNIPVEKGVRNAADCKCYNAVMNTYSKLIEDTPHCIALQAAARVYAYHHPEDKKGDAFLTVQSWITAGNLH